MLYDFIIINKKIKLRFTGRFICRSENQLKREVWKRNKASVNKAINYRPWCFKNYCQRSVWTAVCRGYISNKPRSGYYVEAQFSGTPSKSDKMSSNINKTKRYYEYDFSSKSIDDGIININEWKNMLRGFKSKLSAHFLRWRTGWRNSEKCSAKIQPRHTECKHLIRKYHRRSRYSDAFTHTLFTSRQ